MILHFGGFMEKIISATEAVRKFSDILNSVRYRGESFTIVRGGKPIAALTPLEEPRKNKSLRELKGLISVLPDLGPEADRFRNDLKEIRKYQPSLPKEGKWA
jgi:prevent-host-death family protein